MSTSVLIIWFSNTHGVAHIAIWSNCVEVLIGLFLWSWVLDGLVLYFFVFTRLQVLLHWGLHLVKPVNLRVRWRFYPRTLSSATSLANIAYQARLPRHLDRLIEVLLLNTIKISLDRWVLNCALHWVFKYFNWVHNRLAWWELVANIKIGWALKIIDHYRRVIWHVVVVFHLVSKWLDRRSVLILRHK